MAISRHPAEEEELRNKASVLEQTIAAIFRCDSLDDGSNVMKLLLPSTRVQILAQDPIAADPQLSESMQNVPYLLKALTMQPDEVLGLALDNSLKSIFAHSQVINVMNELFLGNIIISSRCVCSIA